MQACQILIKPSTAISIPKIRVSRSPVVMMVANKE